MNESSNTEAINNLLLHNIDTPQSIQIKSPLTTERASRIPINTEISSCNNINNANNTQNISDASKEKSLLLDSEYFILSIQAEQINSRKESILLYRKNWKMKNLSSQCELFLINF